jgi:hypothetical protein
MIIAVLTIAVSGFILFYLVAHRNTHKPTINHIDLPVPQLINGLNILHLSDLHMENISVTPQRLLSLVKGQPIDIIALTGDYLERRKNIPKFLEYIKALKKLNPKYGVYAVLGNHDYLLGEDINLLIKQMEKLGCVVLKNESVTLKIGHQLLHIIGIDDHHSRHSNVKAAYRNVSEEGAKLVLTHDPNVVVAMKAYDFDYLLSGHFHGGQIHWPKPYHLKRMGHLPKLNIVKGLHQWNNCHFYISEGLGQTGLNIRLRSRPEITLHHIGAKVS